MFVRDHTPRGRKEGSPAMPEEGSERVAVNLNRAISELLERDDNAFMVGEDIIDPYGGAFKITRGLSGRFPGRVLSTPISEAAIIGLASGIALGGGTVVAEIMFADFLLLGFDQLANFAAKTVMMYGRRVPMRMIVRAAVGGGRGYGPTHSQSPQKHFIGIPDLVLVELSPFHDNVGLFEYIIDRATPCIFFENKKLYGDVMCLGDEHDGLFTVDRGAAWEPARLFIGDEGGPIDCLFIAAGSTVRPVTKVAKQLFLEYEANCHVVVAPQLYPWNVAGLKPVLDRAKRVCVVEEGVPGGSWGETVAQQIHTTFWRRLREPVRVVQSEASPIPAAAHLEQAMLVNEGVIRAAAWS